MNCNIWIFKYEVSNIEYEITTDCVVPMTFKYVYHWFKKIKKNLTIGGKSLYLVIC